MNRILVNVEGETEEEFVNRLVRPFLESKGMTHVSARLVGNARQRQNRGGIQNWGSVRRDLIRHIKQDQGSLVGLMVDYYGLPDSWPGKTDSMSLPFQQKATHIEQLLRSDIATTVGETAIQRFRPLIMMHEFESVLFADCSIAVSVLGQEVADKMQRIRDEFGDPEKINDSPQTAPSKRIQKLVPGYQKPLQGNALASAIGIEVIRRECSHFREWIDSLTT